MTEAKFQARVIETLTGQGILVQKFSDLFALGIPDVLAELPGVPDPGIPQGLWLELKYLPSRPKRQNSGWSTKAKPSGAQMGWMGRWCVGQKPCAMLLCTPDGWICVPFAQILAFFDLPYPKTLPFFTKNTPTYGAICRGFEQCKLM